MHVLHFNVIYAEDLDDAVALVRETLNDYGDEDNWFQIGGVVNVNDPTDNRENYDESSRWALTHLLQKEGETIEGKIIGAMNKKLEEALNARLEMSVMMDRVLKDPLDPEFIAYRFKCQAEDLYQAIDALKSKQFAKIGSDFDDSRTKIFNYYDWKFDEYGVTIHNFEDDGPNCYVVMSDMHT